MLIIVIVLVMVVVIVIASAVTVICCVFQVNNAGANRSQNKNPSAAQTTLRIDPSIKRIKIWDHPAAQREQSDRPKATLPDSMCHPAPNRPLKHCLRSAPQGKSQSTTHGIPYPACA